MANIADPGDWVAHRPLARGIKAIRVPGNERSYEECPNVCRIEDESKLAKRWKWP